MNAPEPTQVDATDDDIDDPLSFEDDILNQVWDIQAALAYVEDDLHQLTRLIAEALGVTPTWYVHKLPRDIADSLRDLRDSIDAARDCAELAESVVTDMGARDG